MQADSVVSAVADTATAAPAVIGTLSGFLHSSLPWLSTGVVDWLAHAVASIPIIAVIFGWEVVGKWLNSKSPMLYQYVGKRLEQFAWALNPLLGALIGQTGLGDSSMGLIAGGVWSMIQAGLRKTAGLNASLATTTADGLKKAGYAAALVLAVLLAVPSAGAGPLTASPVVKAVAPSKISLLDTSRWHYSLGLSERWNANTFSWRGLEPKAGAKVGLTWMWSNHIAVQGNVWRQLSDKSKATQAELGISLVK